MRTTTPSSEHSSLSNTGHYLAQSEPRSVAFRLPQLLDLMEAETLLNHMKKFIDCGEIYLDASDVERITTPCAQVLIAAARAAESSGATFQIVNVSTAFSSMIEELGLKMQFNGWMAHDG